MPIEVKKPTESTVPAAPAVPQAPPAVPPTEPAAQPAPIPAVPEKPDLSFLELLLETAAGQPPAPAPAPPAESTALNYEELVKSPKDFEAALAQREAKLAETVATQIMSRTVDIMGTMITRALSYSKAAENFWSSTDNQDLLPFAETFGKVVSHIQIRNPEMAPATLYNQAANVLRQSIARQPNARSAASPLPAPPAASPTKSNGQVDERTEKMRRLYRTNQLPVRN